MRWAILTPERSVRWDGEQLVFGPGARRDQAPPADAGEELWLTYYREHLQSGAPEARDDAEGDAQALLEEPAGSAADRPAGRRRRRTEHDHDRQRTDRSEAPPGDRAAADAGPRRDARRRFAAQPAGAARSAASAAASARSASTRRRRCPAKGPKHARADVRRRAAGRPGGPAGQALRRPGRPAARRAPSPSSACRATQVYVTNAVKHFKFELRGKRRIHKTPAQQEAAACLHWLESEIELVDPAALVALGATAARQLMGRAVAVTRERGQWLDAQRRPQGAGHAASFGAAAHGARRQGRGLRRLARRPAQGRRALRAAEPKRLVRIARRRRPHGVAAWPRLTSHSQETPMKPLATDPARGLPCAAPPAPPSPPTT